MMEDQERERTERQLSVELVQLLSKGFDKEELRTLCFELCVDYDDLPGEGKTNKARDLVTFLERRGRIDELVGKIRGARQGISWNATGVEEPEIIRILAGFFWMGSSPNDSESYENEKPGRKIELRREYWIGRYPVTNAQYADFVLATGHPAPKHWSQNTFPTDVEDHPVVNVSHEDADAYCRWLSQFTGKHYRLPTEEEWEKAARGDQDARRYPWGDEWQPGYCNTKEFGQERTTSVYEFKGKNRSPFGIVDMAGNVWEWTSSWYERYPDSPHGSLKYGRIYRVVRGSSWKNYQREARVSSRGRYKPNIRRPFLGFRVVNMPRRGTIKHEKSCSSAWRCWRQRGIVTTAGIKVGESLVP